MPSDPAEPIEVSRIPLKALGLRTGMALQTRRLVEGASKKESQYFGAIESKGVMVGPLGPEGDETGLTEGEICLVRGFTGQYEFSFVSKVLQTFEKPFVYALLAYPTKVDAHLVRQSMRTKVSWPTTVQLGAPPNAAAVALPATLVDISLQGAMVKTAAALAAVGDLLTVQMAVSIDGTPASLRMTATVCHHNKASYEEAFFTGMAFKDLTQQDKLVLNYLTRPPNAVTP